MALWQCDLMFVSVANLPFEISRSEQRRVTREQALEYIETPLGLDSEQVCGFLSAFLALKRDGQSKIFRFGDVDGHVVDVFIEDARVVEVSARISALENPTKFCRMLEKFATMFELVAISPELEVFIPHFEKITEVFNESNASRFVALGRAYFEEL